MSDLRLHDDPVVKLSYTMEGKNMAMGIDNELNSSLKSHFKFEYEFSFVLYFRESSCGGPKKSPRTSSISHVIFSFRFFEISDDILRIQKFIFSLDTCI